MRIPTQEDLQRLIAWQPPGGVISVYLDLHPEDRGEPWRIELRNGLAAARNHADGHDGAVNATADRIERHLDAEREGTGGRSQIGFVAVAPKPGREEWFALRAALPESEVVYASRPVLAPLAGILDGTAPRGVAVVSGDRVRLLRWSLGGLEELSDWDLEIFSLDWRERKAQRSSDPARVHGAKASGRDQYAQRLDANRERFLDEAGRMTASELRRRGCVELLTFGEPELVRMLIDGAGSEIAARRLEADNLISEPVHRIAKRVEHHVQALQREHEQQVVERITSEVGQGERGALGAKPTSRALAEGRVEHLVLTPTAEDGERLVEAALKTGARVTRARSEAAADALAEAGGIAALLRY